MESLQRFELTALLLTRLQQNGGEHHPPIGKSQTRRRTKPRKRALGQAFHKQARQDTVAAKPDREAIHAGSGEYQSGTAEQKWGLLQLTPRIRRDYFAMGCTLLPHGGQQ